MRLLYDFEEEFPGDVENDLPLSVVLNANKYVVSLASFHGECTVMIYKIVTFSMFDFLVTYRDHHNDFVGETRVFACSGVFIDYHESSSRILTLGSLVQTADNIDDNLEVCIANHYALVLLVHLKCC
jgi:hypothetical protein